MLDFDCWPFQGEWQWAIFLFSLYNVVLSVIFILRLAGFQRIGQKMQNHCARIKIDLQGHLEGFSRQIIFFTIWI